VTKYGVTIVYNERKAKKGANRFMIIAGYPGTGKSLLAETWDRAAEISSMPYEWVLPVEGWEDEIRDAVDVHYMDNYLYPLNFIQEILRREQEGKLALIPSDPYLLERLAKYDRQVLVCYPEEGLKEEYGRQYRQRYQNGEEPGKLCRLCRGPADRWEKQLQALEELEQQGCGTHLRLKSGETLLDYRARIEAALENDKPPVSEETLAKIKNDLREKKKDFALFLFAGEGIEYVYPIKDFDDPQTRRLLYDVSNIAVAEEKVWPEVMRCYEWAPSYPLNTEEELFYVARTGEKLCRRFFLTWESVYNIHDDDEWVAVCNSIEELRQAYQQAQQAYQLETMREKERAEKKGLSFKDEWRDYLRLQAYEYFPDTRSFRPLPEEKYLP